MRITAGPAVPSRPLVAPLLGVIVGLAVATLVWIHDRSHAGPSVLLIGAAIGLLAGVALAVALGGRSRLSGSWPNGSTRR